MGEGDFKHVLIIMKLGRSQEGPGSSGGGRGDFKHVLIIMKLGRSQEGYGSSGGGRGTLNMY